jgi:hypothetical protein
LTTKPGVFLSLTLASKLQLGQVSLGEAPASGGMEDETGAALICDPTAPSAVSFAADTRGLRSPLRGLYNEPTRLVAERKPCCQTTFAEETCPESMKRF